MLCLFLLGCSTNQADENLNALKAFEGVVHEPVFNGNVYLNFKGNPNGPVVVLIHGLGDNASTIWDQTIDKLKSHYFVVTLDLPGFGKSAKGNQLYSPENYARLINYLTQTYIKKPFHLVGHSMGGAITLRYAATYPEDVRTLTLVDVAGILHRLAYTKYLAPLGLKAFTGALSFENNEVTSLAGMILSRVENFMSVDLDLVIKSQLLRASVLQSKPTLISALALVLDDFSLIPQEIKAPTQLIWGEFDAVAPVRTGYVLDALIPDSSLHIIENAGHVPITQKPDQFHQLLIQSIESSASRENADQDDEKDYTSSAFCENQNKVSFTGHIETLTINNCKDVVIKDARLNQLIVTNSRIYLENVEINSTDIGLQANRSTIEMTAGKIQANIAIDAQLSQLDIAGTRLIAQDDVIVASTTPPNIAVFSLSPIFNSHGQHTILHGQFDLTTGKDLFNQ